VTVVFLSSGEEALSAAAVWVGLNVGGRHDGDSSVLLYFVKVEFPTINLFVVPFFVDVLDDGKSEGNADEFNDGIPDGVTKGAEEGEIDGPEELEPGTCSTSSS